MRATTRIAGLVLIAVAGIGTAQAEPGSFFKNMFGGGGGSDAADAPVIGTAPKALDPSEVYCPAVTIPEGAAAIQAFAGPPGDAARLRHQIVLGRMSRECGIAQGGLSVKVGIELRALLGPSGSAGTFDAPVTIAIRYGDKIVASRSRHAPVTVAAGTAQGSASVIEDGLIVPADMADAYDIEVSLGAQARAKPPARTASKRRKPATGEAAVASEAPVAGQ